MAGSYKTITETPGWLNRLTGDGVPDSNASLYKSVPYLYRDEYQYDVTSQPKTDLEREVKPTAPPSPGGGKKLPQTGQLWWPVPVLACAGLGCIAVGLFRRREARDEG